MIRPTIHRTGDGRALRPTSGYQGPQVAVVACWAAVVGSIVNLLVVQDPAGNRTAPLLVYAGLWAAAAVRLRRQRGGVAFAASIGSLAMLATGVVTGVFWVHPWGWQQFLQRVSVPDLVQLVVPSICAVVVLVVLRRRLS